MTAANICEQCKAHASPPRSQRESPCGSSGSRSSATPRSACPPPPTNPSKPVYVRMDPSEKTCIVLGKGECGGNNISLQLPSSPCSSSKLKLKCGDGGGGGGGGNCIEIMGNSIIKTQKGGLQIVPCKGKGGMQISLGKGGCPVLQLGGGSARSCGSSSGCASWLTLNT